MALDLGPLVDGLAHLDDPRVQDRAGMLARARAVGVVLVVNAGVDPRVFTPITDDTAGVGVRYAFGLHPQAVVADTLDAQLVALEQRLRDQDCGPPVALGELGLDRRPGMPPLWAQQKALAHQLDLAKALGLPVLLHAVSATGLLLEALSAQGPLPAGGLLHGFTGPAELVPRFATLGLYFSFGGVLTRPQARRARQAALVVPRERLLVESDTPDHPPRGQGALSEPAQIAAVLVELAALRGEDPRELAAAVYHNSLRLFGERLRAP